MQDRIDEELAFIRQIFPDVEYQEEGALGAPLLLLAPRGMEPSKVGCSISDQRRPPWSATLWDVCPFGSAISGKYAQQLHRACGQPTTFWRGMGLLLLGPADGYWIPSAAVRNGANLLDWVKGFKDRFAEGN